MAEALEVIGMLALVAAATLVGFVVAGLLIAVAAGLAVLGASCLFVAHAKAEADS